MQKKTATKAGIWICLAAAIASPVEAQNVGDIFGGVFGHHNHEQDRDPYHRHGYNQRPDYNQRQRNQQHEAGGFGCAAGGILGGIIGHGTGGKIALGGALCAVGWAIGVALSKRDQERLTARSQALLESDGPHSEVFAARDSKARINLSVGAAQERETNVPFQIDEGVQTPGRGTRIEARSYVASQRLDFRSRPSNRDDDIRGYFDRGDQVEVLGRTSDGQWLLVGDGGTLVGYAPASGIQGAAPRARRRAVVAHARPKVIQRAAKKGGQPTVVTRNASTAVVHTASVHASTTCKAVVAQTGSKSDTHQGCTLPNGHWAIA